MLVDKGGLIGHHVAQDDRRRSESAAPTRTEPFLLTEYSLAHNELRELWSLYWRQASYFLTFNGALLAFVSISLPSGNDDPQNLVLCVFGGLVSVLWLFHGNRYFYYIRDVERWMRAAEMDRRFVMKLRRYQAGELRHDSGAKIERTPVHFLERWSGARLRNTSLPLLTIGIWIIMLVYLTLEHFL